MALSSICGLQKWRTLFGLWNTRKYSTLLGTAPRTRRPVITIALRRRSTGVKRSFPGQLSRWSAGKYRMRRCYSWPCIPVVNKASGRAVSSCLAEQVSTVGAAANARAGSCCSDQLICLKIRESRLLRIIPHTGKGLNLCPDWAILAVGLSFAAHPPARSNDQSGLTSWLSSMYDTRCNLCLGLSLFEAPQHVRPLTATDRA